MDLDATVREWVRLFNAEQYYEAHEVAEEHWHRANEPEKTFLKGLIHAAVSLAHLQRGNPHGARVKGKSAAGYLAPYAPTYAGVALDELLQALTAFLAPLETPGQLPEEPLRPRARLER